MAIGKRQREDVYEISPDSSDEEENVPSSSVYRRRRSWSSSRVADNTNGAISVLLTEPDLLDCPICISPLRNVIYQCENGDIACSACRINVKGKCPSCSMPITFNRCRPLEKLVESVRVECKNKRYGCKETLVYHQRSEHERLCPNNPCFCPISLCGFADSFNKLCIHFLNDHKSSATLFTFNKTVSFGVDGRQSHVILQEQKEGVIFILNHSARKNGRFFDVVCIGPTTSQGDFAYHLMVKCMDLCLSLGSIAEVLPKWQHRTPNKNYLMIPLVSLDKSSQASVELCIKKV